MANLPRELGQMGFGKGLADALASIGKTLGESKRREFVDKTLRDALRGINPDHPESAFSPDVMGKIASVQGYPEAEGSMGAIKMGDSLFGAMANAQTRKDAEKDRQFNDNLNVFKGSFQNYISNREKQDLNTQRGQYQSLVDSKANVEKAYPGRATLPEIPPPVGYGKEVMAKVSELNARASKFNAEAPLASLKAYNSALKSVSDIQKGYNQEIAKGEDTLLKATQAMSKESIRKEFFSDKSPSELPYLIEDVKQEIQRAKESRDALQNQFAEQTRRYKEIQPKAVTGRKFTQLKTEISQDDKDKVDWVQNSKNEGHKNYQYWVDDLKKRGIIK